MGWSVVLLGDHDSVAGCDVMGKVGKQQITASSLWLPGPYEMSTIPLVSSIAQVRATSSYKDLEPVPFTLPVDWNMDPYELKSWRMYFQSLNWIHGYRLAYDKGAAEGLDTMVNILNDWWLKNRDVEEPSAMVWDDHATSDRLANICSIVTLLERPYDHIPNLDAMVSKHVQALCGFYESKKWIRNNHAVFHVGALLDAHLMGFSENTGVDCLQVATVISVVHLQRHQQRFWLQRGAIHVLSSIFGPHSSPIASTGA